MRRYEDVVNIVRQRIEAGVLKAGQRIASVREMSALTGFSLTTVHRAYMQLEAEQIVVAQGPTPEPFGDIAPEAQIILRTDRELAGLWSGKPFLIYGLARQELRAWRVARDDVEELPLS